MEKQIVTENQFVCRVCGKIKADPDAPHCRTCQLEINETLRERAEYGNREHARNRAAIWARAMGFR